MSAKEKGRDEEMMLEHIEYDEVGAIICGSFTWKQGDKFVCKTDYMIDQRLVRLLVFWIKVFFYKLTHRHRTNN